MVIRALPVLFGCLLWTLCPLLMASDGGADGDDGVSGGEGVAGGVDSSDSKTDGTLLAGVYSKQQAKVGKVLYEQHCLVCHDNKYFRPVLKRWSGQQLSVFYDVMSGSMPESNPGGLLDQEYLDILAYILSRSRLPTGDAGLGLDDLDGLTVATP